MPKAQKLAAVKLGCSVSRNWKWSSHLDFESGDLTTPKYPLVSQKLCIHKVFVLGVWLLPYMYSFAVTPPLRGTWKGENYHQDIHNFLKCWSKKTKRIAPLLLCSITCKLTSKHSCLLQYCLGISVEGLCISFELNVQPTAILAVK